MRIRSICAVIIILFTACITMGMASVPTDTNFSCNGLKLGDDYTALEKSFGKPWYSDSRLVYGRAVDYYIYHDKTTVGIAKRTGKIVDITVSDEKYSLPQKVKLGATSYKMQSVFGKGQKELLDGRLYFIYSSKNNIKERLLLQLDSAEYFLTGIRLTSLPLDDEEADSAMYNDDADENILNDGTIDTSAVTSNENSAANVKIGFNYEKSW